MKNSKQTQRNFKEVNLKKIVMLILAMLISATVVSAEENKTQFEFRARPEYRANFNADNEMTRSDFNVVRGYIGMTQKITDDITGRFLIDVDAGGTSSTAGGARTRVKNADFRWAFSPMAVWSFGLMPTSAFLPNSPGNLCNDNAAEYFSQASSADFGTGISGGEGMLNYAIQVVNGEGYAGFRGPVNTIPLVLGNVGLKPMDMISADVSFGYTKNEVENETSPKGYDSEGSIVDVGGQIDIKHSMFQLPIQAIMSMNKVNDDADAINSLALYFEPMFKLKDVIGAPISVLCGIAILDENTDVDDDEETRIIPGLIYQPNGSVKMFLNYEMVNNAATDGVDNSNLRFRIEYRMRTKTL